MRLAPTLLASFVLLLGVLMHAPEHADARCARARWIPTLVTPTEQPLPTQATFLVAMMIEWDSQNAPIEGRFPEDAALVRQVGEGDAATEERIVLRVVPIGAGLARYEPTTRPSVGVYQLVGLGRPKNVTFAARGTLRVPAARPPSRIVLDVGPMRVQGNRGGVVTTRAVRATLPAPVSGPPTAIIAYWEGEAGAAAVIPSGVTEVVLFRESIHCASPLAGTKAPRAGDQREIALVDAFGRVSRRVRQ